MSSKRILTMTAAAGAIAAAGAAPALAGSLQEPAPEPVVTTPAPVQAAPAGIDWSGPYVGGQIGWGSVDTDGFDDDDGVIGGLNAGYRHQFDNNFVLGGEAQYDWSDIDVGEGSLENLGRVKALAGYNLGRTLVYGTAGYARASVDDGALDGSDNGWVAGVGADYMVTERVALGGEILHHQFDDFEDSGADVDATTVEAKMTFNF